MGKMFTEEIYLAIFYVKHGLLMVVPIYIDCIFGHHRHVRLFSPA